MNRYKVNRLAFLRFASVFKFQKNKFKIVQKSFQEMRIILIKKKILRKATSHNDHYMINMDGKRHKNGGN